MLKKIRNAFLYGQQVKWFMFFLLLMYTHI